MSRKPAVASSRRPARADRYDLHPSIAMVESWAAALKEKTGRGLDEWVELIRTEGPADELAQRAWLKTRHKLGTNSAWWLVARAAGRGEEDTPDGYLKIAPAYVDAMYAGPKAALRPLHDRLLKLARSLGRDIRVCPCKTMVPIYRRHVIAQVKPTTRTRIDFGLALGSMKASGRLIDTGGHAKKDRITHRIPISSVGEIDGEVERWLAKAYALNAG